MVTVRAVARLTHLPSGATLTRERGEVEHECHEIP